ncbi:MAG: DUF952 domain-containing protein [Isosphaeraceae bacterium]
MTDILHVTPRSRWESVGSQGEFQGDTLATEGFLHCCLPGQLAGVVARYFRDQKDLVVLRINPERLTSPLKWEPPPGSIEAFPHVYGPLNVDAVVEVVPLEDVLKRPGGTLNASE